MDTPTSTTWLEPNGSYKVTIKATPYQWRDGSGGLQSTSTAISPDKNPGEAYQSQTGVTEEFPASANGPVVLRSDGQEIALSLNGAGGGAPTVSASSATYGSALSGVNVQYQPTTDGMAETDVLASSAAPSTLTWSLKTIGLTPSIAADGSVVFRSNSTKRIVSSMPPPSVVDANGTRGPVKAQLSGNELSINIDPNWLQSSARAFPVTLDPTVTWYSANYCLIMQGSPNNIDCSQSGPSFDVGQSGAYPAPVPNNTDTAQRLLFAEETNTYGGPYWNIPSDATVTSATMGIYIDGVSTRVSNNPWPNLAVYPINTYGGQGGYEYASQSWSQCFECDWTGWTPGGDYESNYPFDGSDAQATASGTGWIYLHPLEAAQQMVNGVYGNQFELMATNELDDPGLATIATGGANEPYLTFTYTIPSNPSTVSQTQCAVSPSNPAVGVASAGAANSYWIAEKDGGICPHNAPMLGSANGDSYPIVAIDSTADFDGYWLLDSNGTVTAYGDANTYSQSATSQPSTAGSVSAQAPAIAMANTANDEGYFVLWSNGVVTSHGNAVGSFPGSSGSSQPPAGTTWAGIATAQSGSGYWLANSTGGVWPYGSAPLQGNPTCTGPSCLSTYLGQAIVSITAPPGSSGGYLLTDHDGNVYSFGSAVSHGELNANQYSTIVGMAMSSDNGGYFVVSSDGSCLALGDAALPPPTDRQSQSVQGTAPTVTTPALTSTVNTNDVLVAFVATNGIDSPGSENITHMTSSDSALEWTRVQQENQSNGDVEIWTATAAAPASNVTVSATLSTTGWDMYLSVHDFGGAVGVGASSVATKAGQDQSSWNLYNTALTTTGANSLVYAMGIDTANSFREAGSGQSLISQWGDSSNNDYAWLQASSAPITTPDSYVNVDSYGHTNDPFNLAAVEIVANPVSPDANLAATGPDPYVGFTSDLSGYGYWAVDNNGQVVPFGDAHNFGSLSAVWGVQVSDIVGIAATPDGNGYWLVGADGGIFSFGDANFYGSVPGLGINLGPGHQIVGIASSDGTPSQQGYWLAGADGGVFAFGPKAQFYNSIPGDGVDVSDVTSIAATTQGNGYWVAEGDGQVTAFGGATWDGDASSENLNANTHIVGIVPFDQGTGYWLVGADGGVFTNYGGNGAGPFFNSAPGEGIATNGPIVGIATPPQTGNYCNNDQTPCGYVMLSSEGTAYPFGNVYGGQAPWEYPSAAPPTPVGGSQPQPSSPPQSTGQSSGTNPGYNGGSPCILDPVNCMNGDLTEADSDVSASALPTSLDLTRTYNSLDARHAGLFGFGWSSSYEANLSFNAQNWQVVATLPGAATLTFYRTGSGSNANATPTYFSTPGAQATLISSTSPTYGCPSGAYVLTLRLSTFYVFNGTGQLECITDLSGDALTLTYGPYSIQSTEDGVVQTYTINRLQEVTDPADQTLTFEYNSGGFVSQVNDSNGGHTAYTYNLALSSQNLPLTSNYGNLLSAQDLAGNTTSYGYDVNHLLLTVTNPSGETTTNVYDGEGRVIAQTNPLGQITTWNYAGENQSAVGGTTVIDHPDATVTLEAFTDGQMLVQGTAAGTSSVAVSNFTYDPKTQGSTTETDPDFNSTTTSYDANGNPIETVDALGNTSINAYNSSDEAWCSIDPAEVLAGRTCPAQPVSSPPAPGSTDPYLGLSISVYDSTGRLTAKIDPLGNTTTYSYTPSGNSTQQGIPPNLQYCSVDAVNYKGGVTCPTYGSSHVLGTASETFDSRGDVLTSTDADGDTTTSTYSATGPFDLPATTTDAVGTGYNQKLWIRDLSKGATYPPS